MNDIIGEQIELNKFDADEASRMSVSGKVIKHFYNVSNSGGFYLLKLDQPFEHKGIEKNHLIFWSPLIQNGSYIDVPVDAFVLLVPSLSLLMNKKIDETQLIPFDWVKASRKTLSKNVFPSISSVIHTVKNRAKQVSIAY